MVAARRLPGDLLECAAKVERAQPGEARKRGERNLFGKVFFDVCGHARNEACRTRKHLSFGREPTNTLV
jgi:hypothetical protein